MSLMSGKFLRGVATGAGKRMLYRMEQNRSIGEKGLETLAQANEIVKILTKTLNKMKGSDGIYSDNKMFVRPKAKKSDLISKIKEIEKRYKL